MTVGRDLGVKDHALLLAIENERCPKVREVVGRLGRWLTTSEDDYVRARCNCITCENRRGRQSTP